MIKELYGEDLRYFSFNDDTFTTSRERVHAICDVIDEVFPRKNDFGFYCEGRVNVLARHPELIRRLKVAGLMRLQIGIESGDQDTLNRINKNIRIREIEQVVKTAYEAGVFMICGAFICGLPGQSEEEVKSDIDFAKRLIDSAPGAMEVAMGMFTPMPGTEFRENAQRWGVKLFDPEFVTGIVIENCLSETDLLKRDTIEELSKLFESEIDRYINSKIYTIHPERLKQAFALAADMNLIPLVVRKLRKYKHCSKLLVLRARQDHRFLHEIPPQEQVLSAPYNVDSTTTSCDEDCIINEGSLMSFVLDKEAMRYYQYFCGKLSFRGIAVRVSRESAESPERCLQACLAVYQKCEDKMSAICMV